MNVELGPARRLTLSDAAGRWVLAATILGSGMALLDTTTVVVALPAIGRALGGHLSTLQWVLEAYLISLAGLVLLGGAIGEVVGHGRVFLIGAAGFGVTSALCGVAGSGAFLVVARLLQGAAASLLVPGSLAIVSTSFSAGDRGRAIGVWSAVSGLATVVGPLLGGFLVDHGGWRWVFLINIPLAAAALLAAANHLPAREAGPRTLRGDVDLGGALIATAGLALVTLGLVEGPRHGVVLGGGAVLLGAVLLAVFAAVESRRDRPLLPLSLFTIRGFAVANLATLFVYAALTASLLLIVLELQWAAGYSALASGAAIFPITLLLLGLSSRAGRLVDRMGARRLMALGPLLAAVGLLLFIRVPGHTSYLTAVLPAGLVFGAGLAVTVGPVTTTILGAVPSTRAGVASGVNNAITRVAGLLGVAAVPLLAGLGGSADDAGSFTGGFHQAMLVGALLCVAGTVVALVGLRRREHPAESGAVPE
ncbi:MAG: MFS transporter [Candidatus Dormibacteria bacterium]